MAKKSNVKKNKNSVGKKTSIGNGKFTKWHSKGGGPNGSKPSKRYRKKYRGQGK
jgi:hypothetical protein